MQSDSSLHIYAQIDLDHVRDLDTKRSVKKHALSLGMVNCFLTMRRLSKLSFCHIFREQLVAGLITIFCIYPYAELYSRYLPEAVICRSFLESYV